MMQKLRRFSLLTTAMILLLSTSLAQAWVLYTPHVTSTTYKYNTSPVVKWSVTNSSRGTYYQVYANVSGRVVNKWYTSYTTRCRTGNSCLVKLPFASKTSFKVGVRSYRNGKYSSWAWSTMKPSGSSTTTKYTDKLKWSFSSVNAAVASNPNSAGQFFEVSGIPRSRYWKNYGTTDANILVQGNGIAYDRDYLKSRTLNTYTYKGKVYYRVTGYIKSFIADPWVKISINVVSYNSSKSKFTFNGIARRWFKVTNKKPRIDKARAKGIWTIPSERAYNYDPKTKEPYVSPNRKFRNNKRCISYGNLSITTDTVLTQCISVNKLTVSNGAILNLNDFTATIRSRSDNSVVLYGGGSIINGRVKTPHGWSSIIHFQTNKLIRVSTGSLSVAMKLSDSRTPAWARSKGLTSYVNKCKAYKNYRTNKQHYQYAECMSGQFIKRERDWVNKSQYRRRTLLRSVDISGTHGNVLYIGEFVHTPFIHNNYFHSVSSPIYFDRYSNKGDIRNNVCHYRREYFNVGRPECFAVDASFGNTFVSNWFRGKKSNGVFLYKNAGERGTIRAHGANNNSFYYDWMTSPYAKSLYSVGTRRGNHRGKWGKLKWDKGEEALQNLFYRPLNDNDRTNWRTHFIWDYMNKTAPSNLKNRYYMRSSSNPYHWDIVYKDGYKANF